MQARIFITPLLLSTYSAALQLEAESQAQFFWKKDTEESKPSGYQLDSTWPADNCCRLYTEDSYWGSESATGHDFCATGSDMEEFDLWTDASVDGTLIGGNKMSSWKCGSSVRARFCHDRESATQYVSSPVCESAGGSAESQDTGLED